MIIYNTVLTDVQCQQVEGYLAWKWCNTNSVSILPTTHPFNAFPVGAFSPVQVPSCFLWLAADQGIIQSGAYVSQWTDQSSYAHNVIQRYSSYQPTYDSVVQCLTCDGVNRGALNASFDFRSIKFSAFVVLKTQQKSTNTSTILDFGVVSIYFDSNSMTLKCNLPSNNAITLYTLTTNTQYILAMAFSLSRTSGLFSQYVMLNVNGTTVYPLTPPPTTVSYSMFTVKTINIGGRNLSTTFKGSIYSVIVYTGGNSDLYIKTEGYLAWKWFGSGSILPNTHAYYSVSPGDVGAQFNTKSVS